METASAHAASTESQHNESRRHKYYPHLLLVIYLAIWVWLAISPVDRSDWWLENILVFLFVPFIIWTYHKFRLSNLSYTLIFTFMVLHTIGAHYTYAEVPFGYWLQDLFGLSRNHFDRIVHFSFGFLLAYPIRELFLRIATTKGFWGYWLPFELTLAFSALYELMEWAIAEIVSPGAGSAFLGSQGDVWDAQKDMAMAGLGALITMCVTAAFKWRYDRHFGEEIKESLEVKEPEPLGEVKLAELKEEMKAEEAHGAKQKAGQASSGLQAAVRVQPRQGTPALKKAVVEKTAAKKAVKRAKG